MQQPTTLQSRLANQIVSHARVSGWQSGHHLTEDSLLPLLGTSRTPIRAAMAWLEQNGILEKRPNRGFFLKELPPADLAAETVEGEDAKDGIYFTIAMDRLARSLPDALSENELMRRYDVSRAQLRLILARISSEGWIERKPGRGWAFLPLIDNIEAYRENYRFRQMLEPASMRAPEFRVDATVLAHLERQQVAVRDDGYRSLSQVELFEINARFHEGLAEMGNNRFFLQSLVRVNQLRRLIEYGRPLDRDRVRRVCDEHLGILARLKEGDVPAAVRYLEQHLGSAQIEKIPAQQPDGKAA